MVKDRTDEHLKELKRFYNETPRQKKARKDARNRKEVPLIRFEG